MNKKRWVQMTALLLTLVLTALLAGCSRVGGTIDPRDWGFESKVTYHAMGGVINTKEIRETYYENGSLIFEPRGTTNMLIRPVRDGYILAGWYKGPDEPTLDENNKPVIAFDAQDRWDFNVDRVDGSMTLYARWIPQGVVRFVDSTNDKVMFSKNITATSPVQPLTAAALRLVDKPGFTMEGYYADKELTTPYDFTTYVHGELVPSERDIYAQLSEEFPDALAVYEATAEDAPPPVETGEEAAAPAEGDAAEDDLGNVEQAPIDPEAYIKRLGYHYVIEDEDVIAQIEARKKEIIEAAILHYEENTAGKTVWLKYTEGRSRVVQSVEDLKLDGRYGFFGVDSNGQTFDKYIIRRDLDFSGKPFEMVAEFAGNIDGGGHTLSNITLSIAGQKMDKGKQYKGALFGKLSGATIKNLVLDNLIFNVNLPSTNHLQAAPLAVDAEKSTLSDITVNKVEFKLGRGDDGKGTYEIADFVVNPADSTLENIAVTDFVAESKHAEIRKDFAK